jgi:hypothetical protein
MNDDSRQIGAFFLKEETARKKRLACDLASLSSGGVTGELAQIM